MMMRLLVAILLINTGCAYQFGHKDRELPGGYREIAIPVFKNKTSVIGAEAGFTNALIREFARSRVSKVVSYESAPAVIEGEIANIDFKHQSQIVADDSAAGVLPPNTVLTSEYRVTVVTNLRLRRVSDDAILWKQSFSGESVYSAAQVGKPVVNTVNPLYDHSMRFEVVKTLAQDMMGEVHTRITESF